MAIFEDINVIQIENSNQTKHGKEYFLTCLEQTPKIYAQKIITDDRYIYGFSDDGTVEDFIDITKAIQDSIEPEKLEYEGITDIVGFFEKNGIKVNMLHIGMYGNNILAVDKNEYSQSQIATIDKWVVMINNQIYQNLSERIESEKLTK